MTPSYIGYHLSLNYRGLELFHFGDDHRRISTRWVRTVAGLTRRERYDHLANLLRTAGCPVPDYQPGRKG